MVKHCKAPFRSQGPPRHHQISRYVQPSPKETADIRVEENIVAWLFLFAKSTKATSSSSSLYQQDWAAIESMSTVCAVRSSLTYRADHDLEYGSSSQRGTCRQLGSGCDGSRRIKGSFDPLKKRTHLLQMHKRIATFHVLEVHIIIERLDPSRPVMS